QVEPGGQRISLIVIQGTDWILAGLLRYQPPADGACPLRVLMRVCQVKAGKAADIGGSNVGFPAPDPRMIQRQRKENIRVSEHIMIEEVPGAGSEVRDVKGPSPKRNGQPKLTLFVALAA